MKKVHLGLKYSTNAVCKVYNRTWAFKTTFVRSRVTCQRCLEAAEKLRRKAKELSDSMDAAAKAANAFATAIRRRKQVKGKWV